MLKYVLVGLYSTSNAPCTYRREIPDYVENNSDLALLSLPYALHLETKIAINESINTNVSWMRYLSIKCGEYVDDEKGKY
jgi:hypothetical protein